MRRFSSSFFTYLSSWGLVALLLFYVCLSVQPVLCLTEQGHSEFEWLTLNESHSCHLQPEHPQKPHAPHDHCGESSCIDVNLGILFNRKIDREASLLPPCLNSTAPAVEPAYEISAEFIPETLQDSRSGPLFTSSFLL